MARKRAAPATEPFDWSFSTPDWADRLRGLQMPLDMDRVRPHLNPRRVAAIHQILKGFRLPDVPGQPALADACGEWFFDVAALAAGGLQSDGLQRIQTLMLSIPKKNAKTTLSAALVLALAMISPRPRSEVLLLGPEQATARIAFRQLSGMILADPALRARWHVREHISVCEDRHAGGSISVRSWSPEAITGTKPTLALVDEAWLLVHPDSSRIMGQLRGGMAANPEGQIVIISTQSDQPPRGLWLEELTKARAVRDGTLILPGHCPILYEPPPEFTASLETASDPRAWEMVNPNLGRSVRKDWLVSSFKEAVSTSETEARRWLSQHANVQVSAFEAAADAWGGAEVWGRAAERGVTMEHVTHNASALYVGVDGGGLDDILAVSVIGQWPDGTWKVATKGFCYEAALKRRSSVASLLRDFERDGDLVILQDGESIEPVVDLLERMYSSEMRSTCTYGFDPAGVAGELSSALTARGIPPAALVGVTQGIRLRPGYQALERRLRARTLVHCGQPLLDWAVSNASQDDTTGMVTKKLSGASKIDPIVALACAAIVALDRPAATFDVYAMIG